MFDLNLSQLIVPGTEATDLLQCLVKVNGQPLPDIAIPHEVKISRCANRIPYATLSFIDGDVATRRFDLSDIDLLSPGHSIEIHAGYNRKQSLVFKGIIVKHALKVLQNGHTHLSTEVMGISDRILVMCEGEIVAELTRDQATKEMIMAYATGSRKRGE